MVIKLIPEHASLAGLSPVYTIYNQHDLYTISDNIEVVAKRFHSLIFYLHTKKTDTKRSTEF